MATHMAEPAAGGTDASTEHLTLEDRIWLLRAMLLMRMPFRRIEYHEEKLCGSLARGSRGRGS